MSNKNDIQAFDQIFKNQLENASINPPAGLWESIASQTAPIKTISTASKWSATWLKAVLVSGTITIGSIVVYQYNKPDLTIEKNSQIVSNKNETINTLQSEVEALDKGELTTKTAALKNNKTDKTLITDETKHIDEVTEKVDNNNHSSNKTIPTLGVLNIPNSIIPAIVKSTKITEPEILETDNSLTENYTEIVPSTDIETKTIIASSVLNIPNVVTPNDDGLNDTYFIEIQGEEYFEMIIYNIKMEKLFETKSKYKAWDCKLPNGELAPEGNYTVFLKYKFHNQEFESQYIKLKVIK